MSLAISRMLLVLELGPYAEECLEVILPYGAIAVQTSEVQLDDKAGALDQLRIGEALWDMGQHDKAYEYYKELVKKGIQPTDEREFVEAQIKLRLGRMLRLGDGCERNLNDAIIYFKQAAKVDVAASYELYLCYRNENAGSKAAGNVKELLMKAVEGKCIDAISEYARCLFEGDDYLGIEKNHEELGKFLGEELELDDECAYYYGMFLKEKPGYYDEGMYYVRKAAQAGIESAIRTLLIENEANRIEAFAQNTVAKEAGEQKKIMCIVNTDENNGGFFVQNLQQKFGMDNVCIEKYSVDSTMSILEQVQDNIFDRVICYFFSNNQKQNLSQGIELLKQCKGMLMENYADFSYANAIAQKLEVYIRNDEDYAVALVDNMLAGMVDRYVKVLVCNLSKDASESLYQNAPLFLPFLKNSAERELYEVITGDVKNCYHLVRNAIALGYMGRKMNIVVMCPEADAVERMMRLNCEGIYKQKELMAECDIVYIKTSLEEVLQQDTIAENTDEMKKNFNLLYRGNYFVVAYDEGYRNVELSMKLREKMIKSDEEFEHLPFIAAFCPENDMAALMSVASVGNQSIGYQWYNNYNVYAFGNKEELYGCDGLLESEIMSRTLKLHLSYYGDVNALDASSYYAACRDFYSRQYNMDSSKCCVIGMVYRLFLAGVALDDWRKYSVPAMVRTMITEFDELMEQEEQLLRAAKCEHNRWNWYMISRGWTRAHIAQVATYMQKGNPRHQLDLAKLHPYLCTWEELGNDDIGVQKDITPILRHYKKNFAGLNLQKMDVDNIRKTKEFL